MELDIFRAHREGIEESMKQTLIMSKALGKPLRDYCTREDCITIVLKAESSETSFIGIAADLVSKGYTLKVSGRTRDGGRYDYFDEAHLVFSKEVFRDKIEEKQVVEAMQAFVRKEFGLEPYHHLDCKVMDLYKNGSIDWATAKKAHHTDCSL